MKASEYPIFLLYLHLPPGDMHVLRSGTPPVVSRTGTPANASEYLDTLKLLVCDLPFQLFPLSICCVKVKRARNRRFYSAGKWRLSLQL